MIIDIFLPQLEDSVLEFTAFLYPSRLLHVDQPIDLFLVLINLDGLML
jgi:hypothetical protein